MLTWLLIVTIVVLVFVWKSAYGRGKIGELTVSWRLNWLPTKDYVTINDIILSYNGSTTQVDHVVVSRFGIFVIETKNYKGIITGSENTDTWIQHLYTEKYTMPNPIRQNKGHIAGIRKLVQKVYQDEIFSIVAFSGASKLRVSSETADVVYFYHLRRAILRYKTVRMTNSQMEQTVAILNRVKEENKNLQGKHASNVRQHIREREMNIANLVCPQCGGTLIRKEGPFGRFYGCSNYPKCKFISK